MASASDERQQHNVLNLSRMGFYRKYFGLVLLTLLASICGNAILVGAFVWVKNQRVEREYFAVGRDGSLTPIIPLGEPFKTDDQVLDWARRCAAKANTFNFAEYREQFTRAKACFTEAGWEQFEAALVRAGSLDRVQKQRLLAVGVPNGPGVIIRKGKRGGVYTWIIQQPVLVNYQGGAAGRTVLAQNTLVEMTVTRVSTVDSEDGVGIAQWVGDDK